VLAQPHTGDFEITGGLQFPNLEINEHTASTLQVVAKDTSTLKRWKSAASYTNQILGQGKNFYFDAKDESGANVQFRTLFGGTQICAKLIDGEFQIPLAGDITQATGKTITTPNLAGVSNLINIASNDRMSFLNSELRIPSGVSAVPQISDIYYNPILDQLLLYDGAVWRIH